MRGVMGPSPEEGRGRKLGCQGEKVRPNHRPVSPTGNTGDRVAFPVVSCGTEVTQPFYCPPLGVATTERV